MQFVILLRKSKLCIFWSVLLICVALHFLAYILSSFLYLRISNLPYLIFLLYSFLPSIIPSFLLFFFLHFFFLSFFSLSLDLFLPFFLPFWFPCFFHPCLGDDPMGYCPALGTFQCYLALGISTLSRWCIFTEEKTDVAVGLLDWKLNESF